MEKLIELLNEYEWKKTYKEYMDYQINEELPYKLDSLKVLRWFIKRLVENDKIDQKGIEYKFQDVLFELEEEIVKEKSDFLIMLLSISDTPIEDLISYLK